MFMPFWLVSPIPLLASIPPTPLWELAVKPICTAFDWEFLAERMTIRLEGCLRWDQLWMAIREVKTAPRAVGWVRTRGKAPCRLETPQARLS